LFFVFKNVISLLSFLLKNQFSIILVSQSSSKLTLSCILKKEISEALDNLHIDKEDYELSMECDCLASDLCDRFISRMKSNSHLTEKEQHSFGVLFRHANGKGVRTINPAE